MAKVRRGGRQARGMGGDRSEMTWTGAKRRTMVHVHARRPSMDKATEGGGAEVAMGKDVDLDSDRS